MKKIVIVIIPLIISSCKKTTVESPISIQDNEGNIYQTVKIGDQYWMSENLNSAKWPDGSDSPYWIQSKSGKLYYSKALLKNKYGKDICPNGWHLPSKGEWEKLFKFLGGDLKTIGGMLKKPNVVGWSESAKGKVGFNAKPNGTLSFNSASVILNENSVTIFWAIDSLNTQTYMIKSNSNEIFINNGLGDLSIGYNFSCRCVKD